MRNELKSSKLGLVIGWGEYTDPYVNSHQRLVLTGTRPYSLKNPGAFGAELQRGTLCLSSKCGNKNTPPLIQICTQ